jgi:hypothetical protein
MCRGSEEEEEEAAGVDGRIGAGLGCCSEAWWLCFRMVVALVRGRERLGSVDGDVGAGAGHVGQNVHLLFLK